MANGIINYTDKSLWNALNGAINGCNVSTPGEINAMFSALGATSPPAYGSQDDLGKRITLQDIGALAYSLTTTGTLYGGVYQLVQVDTGATAANIGQGKAAFLLNTATGGATGSGGQGYVVTDEANTVALTHLCGVFLNAITPGNYGFIQVHGKYTVQYRATVTATTAGGDVIVAGLGTGVFDVPAAGSVTHILLAQSIGNAISTPANGALGTVQGNWLRGRY